MTTPGHERENALERGVLAPYTWFHGSKGVTFGTCQVFRLFIFFSIFFFLGKKNALSVSGDLTLARPSH